MAALTEERLLNLLAHGEVELLDQIQWSSNYTFLVRLRHGDETELAVYKPVRGEQPLWDFPAGTLAYREVAAYGVSEALGWELVPPTTLRQDGPLGPGSLQRYIPSDPAHHYFTFHDRDKARLRPAVVFDALINNADRKAGHILLDDEDHLWLIDHGVCFHVEDKLRTVVWDFAGETIPGELLGDVGDFRRQLESDPLRTTLRSLLAEEELEALARRADRLLAEKRFPEPGPGRPYPWPLV